MIIFTFTPRRDDFLKYQKFRTKMTRSSAIFYALCMIALAFSLYNAITTKDYYFLIAMVVLCAVCGGLLLYSRTVSVKKQLNAAAKADQSLFAPQTVKVTDSTLEISVDHEEGGLKFSSVYPFSIFSAVFDTEEGFYIFVPGINTIILPKHAFPEEFARQMKDRFMKLPVYRNVK